LRAQRIQSTSPDTAAPTETSRASEISARALARVTSVRTARTPRSGSPTPAGLSRPSVSNSSANYASRVRVHFLTVSFDGQLAFNPNQPCPPCWTAPVRVGWC
jgi:hypothetical protein